MRIVKAENIEILANKRIIGISQSFGLIELKFDDGTEYRIRAYNWNYGLAGLVVEDISESIGE